MKYLLIFIFSLSMAWAQEEDCETAPISNAIAEVSNAVAIPNCLIKRKIDNAKRGQLNSLCNECKNEFVTKSPTPLETLSSEKIKAEKKNLLVSTALNEYKKVLSYNMIEVAKMRALNPIDVSFKESMTSCQFKQANQFVGCSPSIMPILAKELSSLQTDLGNELAHLLAKDETTSLSLKKGILNRDVKSACFIPESTILYLSNSEIENTFTPGLIEVLASAQFEESMSFNDILINLEGKISQKDFSALSSISSHPILSTYSSNAKSFIDVLKKLNPKTNENFKSTMFSTSSGERFDKTIARSCEQAFENLSKTLCNPSLDSSDFTLNPFDINSKLDPKLEASASTYLDSDELYESNKQAFNFCTIAESKGQKDLTKSLNDISSTLPSQYSDSSLKNFSQNKYLSDMAQLNEQLCKIQSGNIKCDSPSHACSIFSRWNSINKDTSSLDSRLATSSNSNINSLLRSMIGSPTNLDPKTREILVLQGILPKSDGTLVAQAEIPERQPGYFNKAPAAAPSAPTTVVSQSQSSKISRSNNGQNSMRNDGGTTFQPTTASSSLTPDFSDLLDQSDSNLRDVQNEIMRRLAALPDKKPASQNQAQQIAHDSLKSRGLTNPSLQNALASRMMAPTTLAPSAPSDSFFENNHKETASSSTKTAAEKYKNDGMNRALAEMHGARTASGAPGANGRTPASSDSVESGDKAISTVALNVPEDPKISLGKVFSDKLNKNDPETQMLKVLVNSKKNFILQVNAVNFRVVFDENKKMNILLDSGDRSEAQRIRPQLEIFFKRLGTI